MFAWEDEPHKCEKKLKFMMGEGVLIKKNFIYEYNYWPAALNLWNGKINDFA